MKKLSLIILLSVLFASISIAQEQQKKNHIEFKTCHNNIGNGKDYYSMVENGYQQVRFMIAGINNQKDADALLRVLKSKIEMQKSRIKQDGSFYAFIKKSTTADQVRIILLAQHYDYDFETVLVNKMVMDSLQKSKTQLRK